MIKNRLRSPLAKWIVAFVLFLGVFAVGLWIGWHREWITATFAAAFRKNATAASSPATVAVATPRGGLAPLPSTAPSAPAVALPIASPSAALTPATSTISVADRLLEEANNSDDGSVGTGRSNLRQNCICWLIRWITVEIVGLSYS